MTGCLGEQGLRDFLTGRLDPPSLAAATDHIDVCSTCQAQLDALTDRPSLVLKDAPAESWAAGPVDATGTVLADRYRLREIVGEGGMGTVWAADQTAPLRRAVAVKVIRAGLNGRSVLHRFEMERQALARMDHPNIARVFDGGETGDGRPFFVMELVAGRPLTDYCEGTRLDVRGRLELFAAVCRAVQHAHQKGVVHRDLKPSNVLVAVIDGKPVPKVIDFGIAKAVGDEALGESHATQNGVVVGTLDYMSPEQAAGPGADIDTRSDIYSLGAVLYELLTGSRPLDLHRAGLGEILRMIQEKEPTKPSARVAAAPPRTKQRRLVAQLRGDLDRVVMKCLEKARDRRYESASALARDVERFLAGEPVEAQPPSAAYRLRKFLLRNKGPAVAAGLILFALVAGLGAAKWQAIEADRARTAAETNEQRANDAAEKEHAARLDEERERTFAEAINRFVRDDFLALTSVEGQDLLGGDRDGLSKDTTLRDLLDRAAAKLRARKDLAPRTEAELCWIVGMNYRSVGAPKKGIEFLQRAVQLRTTLLGRDHAHTLTAMSGLGQAYFWADRPDLALPLDEETLRLRTATLGPEHPDTLVSTANLAADYAAVERFDRAVPMFETTLALMKARLGPDESRTLTCMTNLAKTYLDVGKIDRALPMYEETLRLMSAKLGAEHLHTLTCANNLATVYKDAGRLKAAIPLSEDTLKRRKAKLGAEHPDTLSSTINLAGAYHAAGNLDAALPLFETALAVLKSKHDADHPLMQTCKYNLASAYRDAGKLSLALPLFEEAYALRKARYGPTHSVTLLGLHNLARAYWLGRQFDKSVPLFEEALKLKAAKFGRDHADALNTAANLAVNYRDAGRLADAIVLMEEAHRASKSAPELRWIGPHLLGAYAKAGEGAKFTSLLQEQLSEVRATLPPDSPQLAGRLAQFGLVLLERKQWAEAEPLLREALAVRAKKEPNDWRTFATRSMLGGALLGQKKFADAEPLLLAGYEGMKQRERSVPPEARARLTEGAARLVELCEATNRPDDAAKWRKELEERRKP